MCCLLHIDKHMYEVFAACVVVGAGCNIEALISGVPMTLLLLHAVCRHALQHRTPTLQ